MDILRKIEKQLEENDLQKMMTDENVMNFVKQMGFIEDSSKPLPSPTQKGTGFRFKDYFIIVTCVIIGAALSFMYLDKTTNQKIDPAAIREGLKQIIPTEEFLQMLIESGNLAQLSSFDGEDGLPGEKGEPGPPGPPGPMGGVNQGAFNGISGWELRESESFLVEPGNRKTVSMSCSTGKFLLGGGYNAEECAECSGVTSYPSSKSSWETTVINNMSDQPANLKVYVICAEPTL
jgi:hypothetical protein